MPDLPVYVSDPGNIAEDSAQWYRDTDPTKGEPEVGKMLRGVNSEGWGITNRRAAQADQDARRRKDEELARHMPEGYDLNQLSGDLQRLRELEESSANGNSIQEAKYREALDNSKTLQERIDFLEKDLAITDELAKHGQDMRLRRMLRDEVDYEFKDGKYTFYALDDRGVRVESFDDNTGKMEYKGVEFAVSKFLDGELGSRLAKTNQDRLGADSEPSPHTEQNGFTGPKATDQQLIDAAGQGRQAYKQAMASRGETVPSL